MASEDFDFEGEFGDLEDDLDLTLYADQGELITEVVAQTLQSINEGLFNKNRYDLALTGGTLGLAIAQKLVEEFNDKTSEFSGLHIWWSDERYVPADSQERNAQPIRNSLGNSNIKVHEVQASDESESAYSALINYEKELLEVRLDLVILGVGPDGHVASLFPGMADLDDLRTVFLLEDSPKPPLTRISFTMATINSASKVWMVATGESKADAVTKIIEADLSIPASFVKGRDHTRLIVDTDAFFAE